ARPLLRLDRPACQPQRGAGWLVVDSLADAAEITAELGKRAFLTIGVKELAAFADVAAVWFLVRLVEAPAAPLPLQQHEILLGRGPFDEAAEAALMRHHRIELVIAKNSGGRATYGKIAAARAIGLPVMLLRRPPLPPAA